MAKLKFEEMVAKICEDRRKKFASAGGRLTAKIEHENLIFETKGGQRVDGNITRLWEEIEEPSVSTIVIEDIKTDNLSNQVDSFDKVFRSLCEKGYPEEKSYEIAKTLIFLNFKGGMQ